MKKVLEDRLEEYWECNRCEKTSLDTEWCPCPRGSCDALLMGEVITKREIIYNVTEWKYQYLLGENLHYLVELHPDEGIISENFFETFEEYMAFVRENRIKVKHDDDAV